jgi:hypothetical protein
MIAFFILLPNSVARGENMPKDQEEQSFRITDKRLFSEDGELREASPSGEAPKQGKPAPSGPAAGERPQQEAPPGTPAKIDFPSYILSYYTQGLVLLGEVPNPYTNKKEEDLEAARHTVDILALLQEKTKGNLLKEEEQLIESVLYELRMKFMAKTNKIKL